MVIGYYNGTLRCANSNSNKILDRNFSNEEISVGMKEFQIYAVPISHSGKYIAGRSHRPYTVPARFNPLCFINDTPYLELDCTLWITQDLTRTQSNVYLVQFKSCFHRVLCTSRDVI